MKKKSMFILSAVVFCAVLFAALPSMAEDDVETKKKTKVSVSIGATGYYAWWLKPIWGKLKYFPLPWQLAMGGGNLLADGDAEFDDKSKFQNPGGGTFLYGPSLSLAFSNGWSISGNFLTGFYKSYSNEIAMERGLSGGNEPMPKTLEIRARKFDADLLISYKINKWFKFFFGPKYQGYSYKFTGVINYIATKTNVQFNSYGMGAGIGGTFHIVGGLFFLPNISVMSLYGIEYKGRLYFINKPSTKRSLSIGANGVLSFAYYIAKIRTTIAVGGRFQYLYYIDKISPSMYSNDADIFSGINLTVIYTF